MDSKAVKALKDLVSTSWIEVAFLMDPSGRLLVSIGNSPAFSHSGGFKQVTPAPEEEPKSCLYLTSLNKQVYLGIVFSADASIDAVRAEVTRQNPNILAAIEA